MPEFDSSKKIDGIYYLSEKGTGSFDEDSYISVRKKEGRLYPDYIVNNLPLIDSNHPLKYEWDVRKKSFDKLTRFIERKRFNSVLEIGCGNGWLSNGISEKCNCFVTGLDLNQIELKQAARVFGHKNNLKFVYGNIFERLFNGEVFNLIIFASSIQYFKNFRQTISSAFRFLKQDGEVHIIDSYFYDEGEIEQARQRTKEYYLKLGSPEMIDLYFHHSWKELENYNFRIMNTRFYKLSKEIKFIKNYKGPIFPWIIIRK